MHKPGFAYLHVTTSGGLSPDDAVLQMAFREDEETDSVLRWERTVLEALNALDVEGWVLDVTKTETPSLGDTFLYFVRNPEELSASA